MRQTGRKAPLLIQLFSYITSHKSALSLFGHGHPPAVKFVPQMKVNWYTKQMKPKPLLLWRPAFILILHPELKQWLSTVMDI